MAGDEDHARQLALSRQLGRIEEQIRTLFKKFETLEENSTREHRVVHDIVVATSEAVRNLTTKVATMEPLTDDYRETRAEKRGARRLVHILYVTFGGLAGAAMAKVIEIFSARPHL